MIRATLVYTFMALYVLLLAPAAILWTLLAQQTQFIYALSRLCIRISGVLAGIRVRSEGRNKVLDGRTYLFLSNHQGNFDGPVLVHSIPRNWKALIKIEMMRLPLLSFIFKLIKFVPIERTNLKNARMSIDYGASLLSQGHSFVVFPEGTRSLDGQLGAFKKGAFIMAIQAQVPIVPVTIVGSTAVQPPGSYAMKPGIIRVFFHDPIPTEGMSLKDRNQLIELTRQAISSKLHV